MAQVNLRKVVKHYDETPAVRGIDLDIADKEVVVLVGPVGRARVANPEVFLCDEPLSNLDAKLRVHMRTEIKKVHQTVRTTTVYVTHDQVEAMTLADRVVVMNAGRIEQVGTPHDLYHSPATLFVAGFIGSPAMNIVRCGLEEAAGALRLQINGSLSLPVPQERVARYRPYVGKPDLLFG